MFTLLISIMMSGAISSQVAWLYMSWGLLHWSVIGACFVCKRQYLAGGLTLFWHGALLRVTPWHRGMGAWAAGALCACAPGRRFFMISAMAFRFRLCIAFPIHAWCEPCQVSPHMGHVPGGTSSPPPPPPANHARASPAVLGSTRQSPRLIARAHTAARTGSLVNRFKNFRKFVSMFDVRLLRTKKITKKKATSSPLPK